MPTGNRHAGDQLRLPTSVGAAEVALDRASDPVGLVVLGHGAGGGVDARDLTKARSALLDADYAVARVTQPYRVAGRKAPAPARQLDAAFTEVVTALRDVAGLADVPLVTGGRSAGARVACRTAAVVDAVAVVALAFPLHPPGRPESSRAAELHATPVPVLVVQGERDPFGWPSEVLDTSPPASVTVHPVPGADHGLAVRKGEPPVLDAVADAVVTWLGRGALLRDPP